MSAPWSGGHDRVDLEHARGALITHRRHQARGQRVVEAQGAADDDDAITDGGLGAGDGDGRGGEPIDLQHGQIVLRIDVDDGDLVEGRAVLLADPDGRRLARHVVVRHDEASVDHEAAAMTFGLVDADKGLHRRCCRLPNVHDDDAVGAGSEDLFRRCRRLRRFRARLRRCRRRRGRGMQEISSGDSEAGELVGDVVVMAVGVGHQCRWPGAVGPERHAGGLGEEDESRHQGDHMQPRGCPGASQAPQGQASC